MLLNLEWFKVGEINMIKKIEYAKWTSIMKKLDNNIKEKEEEHRKRKENKKVGRANS